MDTCELDARGATTEIYDTESRRFHDGPQLLRPRVGHAAVRLEDESILVFGGWDRSSQTASAERWRPGADRFEPAVSMSAPRGGFTVTKLRDGRVLVVGGSDKGRALRSAELYDPADERFVATGSMRVARDSHTATLLPDGRVLVAGGGAEGEGVFASVEIWSPRTGRFTSAALLLERRHKHAAVAGREGVLVVGGSDERDFSGRRSSAELYRPDQRRWVRVGPLSAPRFKLGDAIRRASRRRRARGRRGPASGSLRPAHPPLPAGGRQRANALLLDRHAASRRRHPRRRRLRRPDRARRRRSAPLPLTAGGAPTHELERVGVRRTAAREVPIDRDRHPLRRYADRRSGA